MHIALCYYETTDTNRVTKTQQVLRTMGVSVFLGGSSTLLGVLPLSLASTTIFSTIFVTFVGIVSLGMAHGLILFPVILSLCGPQVSIAKAAVAPDPDKRLITVTSTAPEDFGSTELKQQQQQQQQEDTTDLA